jgi:hypothetical protein
LIERNRIIKACVEEYPRIQEDIVLPKRERGLTALLRDHLLDLNLFIEESVKGDVNLKREGRGVGDTSDITSPWVSHRTLSIIITITTCM